MVQPWRLSCFHFRFAYVASQHRLQNGFFHTVHSHCILAIWQSYIGIVVVESGIIGWYDLRPNVLRLFPSARKRLALLPAKRQALKKDLRAFLRRIGPELGDIYSSKTVDWAKIQEENEQLSREDAVSKKEK